MLVICFDGLNGSTRLAIMYNAVSGQTGITAAADLFFLIEVLLGDKGLNVIVDTRKKEN